MEELKSGDIVWLKSGSPALTVICTYEGNKLTLCDAFGFQCDSEGNYKEIQCKTVPVNCFTTTKPNKNS